VLTNAIDFQDAWASEFFQNATTPTRFQLTAKEEIEASMMP